MTDQLTKESFFAALDRLDESEDEHGNRGHVTTPGYDMAKPKMQKVALASDHGPVSLSRNSDPQSLCDIERESAESSIAPNPVSVNRAELIEIMPKSAGPPSKRRKTNNVKLIPDGQKIFKGLVFFFCPNNDVSPFRRLRIQRAQEYGARWSREWSRDITHAILDKGLQMKDLQSYLKGEDLPTGMVVVNESYPSECIQFRSILNHSQLRFRVDGMTPVRQQSEPAVLVSQDSNSRPSHEKPNQLAAEVDNSQKPDRGNHSTQQDLASQSSQPFAAGQVALPQNSRHEDRTPPKSLDAPLISTIPESDPQELMDQSHKDVAGGQPIQQSNWERDALDDIIDEAKATSHLPLDLMDSPDDGNEDGVQSDSENSSSEESNPRRKAHASEKNQKAEWTQGFACMQKYDPEVNEKSPNSGTIDILQQMLDYYTRNADQWRTLAYRRAIAALRKQKTRITTKAQARAIPGVGQRLADKIEEIVMTNRLRRLENANNSPEDLIIQQFLGVYGAGLPQATKWVAQGYRSLTELSEKASLSKSQRIGVERYSDFAQRIPRKEVEAHGAIVRKAVQSVDKDIQVIIGGSYRRGALTCGDVDCLITKPGSTIEQIRTIMLALVVPKLLNSGFLKASLAISSHSDGSKWHGASAVPGTDLWRRIDLLFVPDAEIGAALIYFTGNDIFNRSMRLLARKKGMCLNQKGLYNNVLRDGQVKLNEGRLLEGRNERRIFALLGVPWRPPEHRIC
ncbi:DNA polymerase family X [Penicillium brevicompactum]|uniref:DNA polymerase lambda n=1 Tax=Penicillium brevicompactum TaxID=5074 RepID=A0A9W9UCN3_PENBR|nr:DNA polymerase family X [Penicillium brevicompactum]